MATNYNTNYNTNTYNNTSDTGGGGFMSGTQGGIGGSQAPARSYQDDSLRPITIHQVSTATQVTPDSTFFQIDNADVSQVTFVGQVRAIAVQPTHITYRLDDGTGVIEVKKWIDADKPADQDMDMDGGDGAGGNEFEKPIKVDHYARVWGKLKSFGGKKHVGAHVIRAVEDFNEVNFHLLEATYCHLLFSRGGGAHATADGGMQPQQQGGGDGMFVDSFGGGGNDNQYQQGGGDGGGGGNSEFDMKMRQLPAQERKICYFLRDHSPNSEGCHATVIADGTKLSVADVMRGCEMLVNAGHAYTTVDDEHWALLEC